MIEAIRRITAGRPAAALADAALLTAIAAAGLVLALQGWRNVAPAIDMVAYFRGSEDLIRHAVLPSHGDVSSYGSFSPPGAAWLMAPGMLIFDDPRLYEKLGSAALHVLAVVGIFLLAREAFGRPTAWVAAAIYGVSGLALAFAGSLWPIGHPVFAAWVAWLAIRWVTRRDARYLSAAALTLGIGLYDTLRIAPLAFVLPALWLAYRPPISVRGVGLVAALTLLVWMPFLGLQVDRGFADLRSQLTLLNIVPADDHRTWCDPSFQIQTLSDEAGGGLPPQAPGAGPGSGQPAYGPRPSPGDDGIMAGILNRIRTAAAGIVAPYAESAPWIPGAIILALLSLIPMAAVALTARPLHKVLARLRQGRDPSAPAVKVDDAAIARRALVIVTAVPWLILLAVAEPGLSVRFLWLWSLLVVWLAACVTVAGSKLGDRVAAVLALCLLVGLAVNPIQVHAGSWLADGWEGVDPPEVLVADAVAEPIHAAGRTSAAIGYRTFIYPFFVTYNVIDPDYRAGTELDMLLRYREGIVNTNRCPEGLSPADEYRIIQIEPLPGADVPRSYIDAPVTSGFHTVAVFHRYQLLVRD